MLNMAPLRLQSTLHEVYEKADHPYGITGLDPCVPEVAQC